MQPFVCTTCGAEKLYDATVRTQAETIAQLTAQRDEAIHMLADWCVRVDVVGTGWDDWDEAYKDAMYRPCGIRQLLDEAIAHWRKAYA